MYTYYIIQFKHANIIFYDLYFTFAHNIKAVFSLIQSITWKCIFLELRGQLKVYALYFVRIFL